MNCNLIAHEGKYFFLLILLIFLINSQFPNMLMLFSHSQILIYLDQFLKAENIIVFHLFKLHYLIFACPHMSLIVILRLLMQISMLLNPSVGMVGIFSPIFNLYRRVVFPAPISQIMQIRTGRWQRGARYATVSHFMLSRSKASK